MWYRIELPLRQLEKHGHQVTFMSAGDEAGPRAVPVTLAHMAGHDLIIGQRFNTFRGLGTWRRARTPFTRLVYENDDDVFSITPENWNAYRVFTQPEIRDAVAHMAGVSDLVTVTTPTLARVMQENTGCERVAVLPNCIPAWVLDLPRKPRERPAVGYHGGASHGVDVGLVAQPVRRFLKRFPGWDLQLGGTDYRPTFRAGEQALFTDWVEVYKDPRGFYETLDFDIGLAPLAVREFNESKCIDANSRISTDQGVIEAGAIEPGMRVWLDGWHDVEAAEHQPERTGLRITTSRGLQLAVTPEHRLMDSGGVWRQARDLRPGDRLQLVREQCPELACQQLPWPADSRVTRAGTPEPMAFLEATEGPRVDITEAWGRIIGLFTGDGCANGKTAISFSCDGQDQDLIKLLITDLESAGLRATTEQVTTYGGQVLRRRSVRVASAHLARFLAGAGVLQPHRSGGSRWERTLRVPDVIFRSPLRVRAAFAAGLFEADGHVALSAVALTSKSENLARDVQRLLWSIGVPSVVRRRQGPQRSPYADRYYWQVWLRAEETRLFAAQAGFLSQRKQAKLAQMLDRGSADRVNRNGDRRGYTGNSRRPVEWTDEITEIESCTLLPVDIQVTGQAFSAAGICSHNSDIKVLEYAARGIVPVASDCTVYRGFIRHGVNGFLVKADHEWLKYLSILARDPALRARMAAEAKKDAARRTIEEHYVLWERAYESLFKPRAVTSG